MHELLLETRERESMVDITDNIRALVRQSGIGDGVVVVQSAHTTLGLTINENADPAVQRDFLAHLKRLVPRDAGFIHQEGNSDSHIKVSLTAPSVTVIVARGNVVLGTWQGIFAVEFDGPRQRRLYVQVVPSHP